MASERDKSNWSAYEKAKDRVEELKGFYWHLVIFILVQSFLFLNYYISSRWTEGFESWIVLLAFLGWGIGLALHAWHVFGETKVLGRDWEEKKIREFMEEERKLDDEFTKS